MAFSLDQFYKLNRRALIWIILLLLLYLLRDFFGLIFLTFVLAFFAAPLANFGQRYLRLNRRISIIIVYGLFLIGIVSFFTFVTPRVIREANTVMGNMGDTETKLLELKKNLVADYPSLNPLIMGYMRSNHNESNGGAEDNTAGSDREMINKLDQINKSLIDLKYTMNRENGSRTVLPAADAPTTAGLSRQLGYPMANETSQIEDEILIREFIESQAKILRENLPRLAKLLWQGSVTMMLALLFSFLISMDISRLGAELKRLEASRLHDFYVQTAQPVVRFAYVVGRALQAQAVIAINNTVLTVIGLLILDVPSIAMLSVIVFFCSFIPVLGVFISTVPIMLLALNKGGFHLAMGVVVMVIIVHAIEAYLLNPLIYGKHLKINPVIVLIILFVGHHAFGLWGMLLGVPVSYYFIHDVFGVPIWDEHRLNSERKTAEKARAAAAATASANKTDS